MMPSLLLTPRSLLTSILFVALFVMPAQPVTDPDLWWHLRSGQWIVDNGAIPMTDPFSFTAQGKPWVEHEWLSNLALYWLYQIGGLNLLILVTCTLIALTFGIVYRVSALRPTIAVFTTLLAALASAFAWDPRPQIVTMLFAALTLALLKCASAGRHLRLMWLLPLMLLWVNLHGGFFLGLVFIATALVGECAEWAWRRWVEREATPIAHYRAYLVALLCLLISSLLITLLNPHGVGMYLVALHTLGNQTIPLYINEWRSPNFHDPRMAPYAMLWLWLLLAMALSKRRPHMTDLFLVLGLGYESLVSARNIPFFVLAVAPLITHQMAAWPTRSIAPPMQTSPPTRLMQSVNWVVLAVVLLAAGLQLFDVLNKTHQQVAQKFPTQTADYLLQTKPAGPLLNSYNFGGYLIWRLYPTYLVFIDGRAEFIYDDQFISEYYVRIWQAQGDWSAYLDRFHINLVVIEKQGALAQVLRQSIQWRLMYEDSVAAVFQRKP